MKKLFTLVIVMSYVTTLSHAQDKLKTINKALAIEKQYLQYVGYYSKIKGAKEIIDSLDLGLKAKQKFGNWESIFFGLQKSVENMNAIEFNDPAKNDTVPLSAEDLFDCKKKDGNMKVLEDMRSNIDSSIQDNNRVLEELSIYEASVDSASQIIIALVDVHAKLSQVPIYKDLVKWDWLVFDTQIKPEMFSLQSAIIKKKKEFSDKISKNKRELDNLSGNMENVKKIECDFSGVYTGMCITYSVSRKWEFDIKKDPQLFYTGQIKIDDEEKTHVLKINWAERDSKAVHGFSFGNDDNASWQAFRSSVHFTGYFSEEKMIINDASILDSKDVCILTKK